MLYLQKLCYQSCQASANKVCALPSGDIALILDIWKQGITEVEMGKEGENWMY